MSTENPSTQSEAYTKRLTSLSSRFISRIVGGQPYRWKIRRIAKGSVLEVGCGIGRNLNFLGSRAVGVDHNSMSIKVCKERGFTAYTPDEFFALPNIAHNKFDAILLSHVIEHLTLTEAHDLLHMYIKYLSPSGKLIIICPQQRGFASDSTHVTYFDLDSLAQLVTTVQCSEFSRESFPFPAFIGRWFTYNEWVYVSVSCSET
jgi:2-polyprenyl-3-methyl-5-hydroxy-6-metoxy-1,4-benzoquinol methylase